MAKIHYKDNNEWKQIKYNDVEAAPSNIVQAGPKSLDELANNIDDNALIYVDNVEDTIYYRDKVTTPAQEARYEEIYTQNTPVPYNDLDEAETYLTEKLNNSIDEGFYTYNLYAENQYKEILGFLRFTGTLQDNSTATFWYNSNQILYPGFYLNDNMSARVTSDMPEYNITSLTPYDSYYIMTDAATEETTTYPLKQIDAATVDAHPANGLATTTSPGIVQVGEGLQIDDNTGILTPALQSVMINSWPFSGTSQYVDQTNKTWTTLNKDYQRTFWVATDQIPSQNNIIESIDEYGIITFAKTGWYLINAKINWFPETQGSSRAAIQLYKQEDLSLTQNSWGASASDNPFKNMVPLAIGSNYGYTTTATTSVDSQFTYLLNITNINQKIVFVIINQGEKYITVRLPYSNIIITKIG